MTAERPLSIKACLNGAKTFLDPDLTLALPLK
jgi:hypothetical protein